MTYKSRCSMIECISLKCFYESKKECPSFLDRTDKDIPYCIKDRLHFWSVLNQAA